MSTTRKMLILFFAIVVLVVAGIGVNALVHRSITTDPKQLFDNALNQNLSGKAVTCTVATSKSGTAQTLAVQLDLAGKTNAHSLMTITTDGSTVQTEEIVVKAGDYLRYTKVASAVKNADGKQPDFSKILNQWIKTDGKTAPQLFGLTALGGCVVPLANVSTTDKATLVSAVENGKVFVTDPSKSVVADLSGQPTRQYQVAIQPGPYVTYMQAVGKLYGLTNLQSLNISDYNTKTPRKAVFYVNTKTGRLVEIQFTDESRVVTFGDYGKTPELKAPAKTITNAQASKLVQ